MKGRNLKMPMYDGLSKLMKALANPATPRNHRNALTRQKKRGRDCLKQPILRRQRLAAPAGLKKQQHRKITKGDGHYVYYSLVNDEFLSLHQHITKYAVREIAEL